MFLSVNFFIYQKSVTPSLLVVQLRIFLGQLKVSNVTSNLSFQLSCIEKQQLPLLIIIVVIIIVYRDSQNYKKRGNKTKYDASHEDEPAFQPSLSLLCLFIYLFSLFSSSVLIFLFQMLGLIFPSRRWPELIRVVSSNTSMLCLACDWITALLPCSGITDGGLISEQMFPFITLMLLSCVSCFN